MSKKKLIITITSLCLVIVAAVAAVVGVVAASTQTVTSTVSVSYVATNVKATMGVTSKLQKDDSFGTTRATSNTVSFDATEASSTKTLTVSPTVTLGNSGSDQTSANWKFERYIIYRYSFHNDYAAGQGRAMKVTFTYDSTKTSQSNVRVAFATQGGSSNTVPTTATTEPSGDSAIAVWNTTNVPGTSYAEYSSALEITVAQAQTGYIYVLIAIQNPLADASFSTTNASAFSFVLSVVNS
jgi:hypothetical protein